MNEIYLCDPQFKMYFGGGRKNDIWALHGISHGHPNGDGPITVSTPKEWIDKDNFILKTYSNRVYRLIDPDEKTVNEIDETIKRGGYSKH